MRFTIVALCAITVAAPRPAAAEPLTLEDVLAIARASAPSIRAVRAGAEERAALATRGALLLPDNPEIELAGRRRGDGSFGDEYEVAIAQPFSGLFSHGKRASLATATSGAAELDATSAERALLVEVADAFLRLAEAERRLAIATELRSDSSRLLDATRARLEAGDVATIDMNRARAEHIRAVTALALAAAEAGEARAALTGMTGLPPGTRLEVKDDALGVPSEMQNPAERAAAHPEVRALDAAIEAARAEAGLATAFHASEWSLALSAGKEEGDDVVEAGIGISLPVFERRQAASAAATARFRRAESERAAVVARLTGEIEAAEASHRALHPLMQTIDAELIPALEENVTLAMESWEAGRIGLADVILVRRELFAAQLDRSEHWRRTREAEVRVRFLTGDLP